MRFVLPILVLALFAVACSPAPEMAATTQETSAPSTPQSPTETVGTAVAQQPLGQRPVEKISLVVDEYSWTPSEIRVKQGTTVELTVTNNGEKPHGLGMPGMNVNVAIPVGETKTVTFLADAIGSNRFFCSIPCGSGHNGMVGTFVVE